MDSNSPTSLFVSYEQDFTQIVDAIRKKFEGEGNNEGGKLPLTVILGCWCKYGIDLEQRKAALRRMEMELDEADEVVCTCLDILNPLPSAQCLAGIPDGN
jgi:vesicle transport through interaction with t-SNAREs protein 1